MKKHSGEHGFTLIEMSIVILILGLVTGAFFSFYTPVQEKRLRDVTRQNQERMARALTQFAQTYGNLPCPARPQLAQNLRGWPLGYVAGTTPQGACAAEADRHGIVPYRVLGLREDDVLDGWGRPISYTVDQRAQAATPTTEAHQQCRQNTVWVNGGVNANARKAAFCCLRNDNSAAPLEIYVDAAATQWASGVQRTIPSIPAAQFAAPNSGVASPTAVDLSYFAFVLVSHGRNGERSFTLGQANRKANVSAGPGELENANDNRVFVDLPHSTAAGSYFDDVVLWRTQRMMLAEMGDNCARP